MTKRLIERAVAEHGRVDVLVNDMGVAKVRVDGFLGTSDEDFETSRRLNFLTAVKATTAP